jgi:hypothetical protein
MRVQDIVFFVAAFTAAEASASSIEALQASASSPSIVTLGVAAAIDPSIVAATPTEGPAPSIVALTDTPASETPSIIALGGPAPADETIAAESATSERMTGPMVIRGGEIGQASARPTAQPSAQPQQAATQPGVPLLDPNDRGTPAKRKALKRQEERLAREAAAGQSAQPDPSTEPVPLGQ